MLWAVLRNSRRVHIVLIDTYSSAAFYYCVVSAALAVVLRIPYVPILHGGDLPARLKRSPWSIGLVLRKAACVVAVSNYLLEAFHGYGNIRCVPNPLNIRKYRYRIRKQLRPRLLWVRSFHQTYNPVLAVEVLSRLREKYEDARLCMVGPAKDDTLQQVIDRAAELSLSDCLALPGLLTKEEWLTLSDGYDIFINTTNFDNMPVSVIEAMALGMPVVSTNVGGLKYLIDDRHDGLLVRPGNAEEFCDRVEELLQQPALVETITSYARTKVEQFDVAIVLEQWNKVIHESLQSHS